MANQWTRWNKHMDDIFIPEKARKAEDEDWREDWREDWSDQDDVSIHQEGKNDDRKGFVQYYIELNVLEKRRKLQDILDALDFNQVVLFVKSVTDAQELNSLLGEMRYSSISIDDGMSHEDRLSRCKRFNEGFNRIIVSTHLVRSVIDSGRVNIVINYDMPDSADTYLDTVARVGPGVAISFVSSPSDNILLLEIQKGNVMQPLPAQIEPSMYQ